MYNNVYALGDVLTHGLWGAYLSSDDTAMDIDISIGTTSEINATTDFTVSILGYLQIIGTIMSVITLIIIGFRYMFSSLEEIAQMKGVIGYYIAGAVLVFATSNLLSVVYNVLKDLSI